MTMIIRESVIAIDDINVAKKSFAKTHLIIASIYVNRKKH